VAISQFVRTKHIEAGLSPERVLVKPHFTWPSPRREGPGEFFLYLGRLSPEKGVGTLLEAWRRIEARLVVVGDGPDREELRSLAPPNVDFREPVAPELVPDLLLGARAVMAPSLSHEGAGRVILEAYAAGVPVIASRAGGLPEVVRDGTTGLLVPSGDPGAWVDGVRRLLDDSLSERMGRAGQTLWQERYNPERGLASLEDAYSRALELARSAG
jgi:glycosyltransferase involved in cell wall biosynthesis